MAAERDPLKHYKELGYGEINQALREARNIQDIGQPIRGYIEGIDRRMVTGEQPIRLWRGIRNLRDILSVTQSIVHRNYASSAKDLDVAKVFVNDKVNDGVISFVLPASVKRHDYADEKHEKEVLIQRGIEFRVNPEFRLIKGVCVYEAEVFLYTEPVPIPRPQMPEIEEKKLDIMGIASSLFDELDDLADILDKEEIGEEDIDEIIKEKAEKNKSEFPEDIYNAIRQAMIDGLGAFNVSLRKKREEEKL